MIFRLSTTLPVLLLLLFSFFLPVAVFGQSTPTPNETPTPNQTPTPTPNQGPVPTQNPGPSDQQNLVANLEQPTGAINQKIKVLPSIVVSNLTPGWEYRLRLGGEWDGTEVERDGDKKFQADSSGRIVISNLCDNGEADRTDCEDVFKNGDYTIKVYQLNNILVGNFNFTVSYNDEITPYTPTIENDEAEESINTAIGNISTDPKKLVNTLLTIAIGIAGGVAFLMIVFGGFRLAFSQGDPKAVQEARDVITSAIVGLLLVIFSVFLLNLIGVDILGLPIGD